MGICRTFFFLFLISTLFSEASAKNIQVLFSKDFPLLASQRILKHLSQVEKLKIDEASDPVDVVLSFGPSEYCAPGVTLLGESYEVFKKKVDTKWVYCALGEIPRAMLYGAYDLLETLGFAFLHPFTPFIPEALKLDHDIFYKKEAPHWKSRGIHLHTMHPIELTNFLNGWGKLDPWDEEGFREMIPAYESFLEWLIANKQNTFQWILLRTQKWTPFTQSIQFSDRLQLILNLAHDWQLEVGVDVPLALEQQNAWRLINDFGSESSEIKQIKDSIDFLMGFRFDFLSTEMGFSEFTSPSAKRMLLWMNTATKHLDEQYSKPFYTKVHISKGQKAKGYKDPETGKDLNFNYLPYYADPKLGVLPHTVQHYSLNDPAPVYGNENFKDMHRYLTMEIGRRPILWFPETAYWVSFDIDVPLFLPLYAKKRLVDIQTIRNTEILKNQRINGQMIFSSGWEYGYWLNDVVTARGAWSPPDLEGSVKEHFKKLLSSLENVFGQKSHAILESLWELIEKQDELLIHGKIAGKSPDEIIKHNGQAYLQGTDTWDKIAEWIGRIPFVGDHNTQPVRMSLKRVKWYSSKKKYTKNVRPLLKTMEQEFQGTYLNFLKTKDDYKGMADVYWRELRDGFHLLSLRSQQVFALYDYASKYQSRDHDWKKQRLRFAKNTLNQALKIVKLREIDFRIDSELIAGWGENPTVYGQGYLWTAQNLTFWLRDEGIAQYPTSICFLNIIDPVKTAWEVPPQLVQSLLNRIPVGFECLFPPVKEPNILARVRLSEKNVFSDNTENEIEDETDVHQF